MAQLTITVPDAEVSRIRAAFASPVPFGETPTPATIEEVRQAIIRYVIDRVRTYEYEEARRTALDAVVEVTPT